MLLLALLASPSHADPAEAPLVTVPAPRPVRPRQVEAERAARTDALTLLAQASNLRKENPEECVLAEVRRKAELATTAYFARWDGAPESAYMHFAYGEQLYFEKRFDEAWTQYETVVAMDPTGGHAQFCAESAIFAADEMIKRDPKRDHAPGKEVDPLPLTEWETRSLATLDLYARLYPNDPKASKVVYKSAYLLYNTNHFADAETRFRAVMDMAPTSKEGEQAANLILDAYALVEDWTRLRDTARAFYERPDLGSADAKKEFRDIYENASLKVIETDFKRTGDKATAAAAYEAFVKEFPGSYHADVALDNAATYYRALERTPDAVRARLALVEGYPKSRYYVDTVAKLGSDYERIGQFKDAADWYEKLFSLRKDHPKSREALYSAAALRTRIGQEEQGIKDRQMFVVTFPDDPANMGLQLEIAHAYGRLGNWDAASMVYRKLLTYPPSDPQLLETIQTEAATAKAKASGR